MTSLPLGTVLLLACVSLVASTVDAIGGGGGLLTLPSLVAAGLPPHFALGTNKGQSVFGSFASFSGFARGGMIEARRVRVAFPAGMIGALCGARAVLWIDPKTLRPIVLGLLVLAAVFVALRRPTAAAPSIDARKERSPVLLAALAFLLGGYDGFFGPGVGTFLIVAFVGLFGETLARASASAKIVNFASNLAALSLFAWRGVVLWSVALPMAAGQLAGGWIGAHLAIRRGDALVRRIVLLVVAALVVKLARDLWVG